MIRPLLVIVLTATIAVRNVFLSLLNLAVALQKDVADRVCFLDGGKILEDSPPEKLFRDPQNPRT